MLRSFTAPFYARGDTATPVKAALLAASVNIALKVLLMGTFAQVGLALATSAGAWINLSLLTIFARRKGFAVSGAGLRPVIKLFVAGAVLAVVLYFGDRVLTHALKALPYLREEIALGLVLLIGTIVYALAVLLLLGRGWLNSLLRDVGTAAEAPAVGATRDARSDAGFRGVARQHAAAQRLALPRASPCSPLPP